MRSPPDLHSPKQVARALGVSESSLKRWCDRGLIKTIKTAGGHRRVLAAEAIRFAQSRGITLASPEILGLPPATSMAAVNMEGSAQLLADLLLEGNDAPCRQIVLNLVYAGLSISRVFDEVIAKAFSIIGERWACREADVYQERRGCEIMLRTLAEVRKLQSPPDGTLKAIGGTATGNIYSLQTVMSEIVLRDCGFDAVSVGTSIPFESLSKAVNENLPAVFWLSAAYIPDEAAFLKGFSELSSACAASRTALVVGGRALTHSLREQMVYASYCDTMQQLDSFAKSLIQATSGTTTKDKPRSRNA
jgi:MerR family transcriptional regulator, light-induced transcriptional regulator